MDGWMDGWMHRYRGIDTEETDATTAAAAAATCISNMYTIVMCIPVPSNLGCWQTKLIITHKNTQTDPNTSSLVSIRFLFLSAYNDVHQAVSGL